MQEERVGGVIHERPEAPLARAQLGFRAAGIGHVLHGAENPARQAGVAPRDVALAVDDAHLSVLVDHPVLDVVPGAAPQRLGQGVHRPLPIVGVHERPPLRIEAREIALGVGDAEDAQRLRGERHPAGDEIAIPVAHVRHALRLGQPPFTRAQTAQHEAAGEAVGKAAADLLQQPHFVPRPDARVRTLVQAERVGFIRVRVDRHRDQGLDAELTHPRRQRVRARGTEAHGAVGRAQRTEAMHVFVGHLHVAALAGRAVLGAGALGQHAPGRGVGVARMHQVGAIAGEDRERGLEHVAHHLIEIARPLDDAVDAVHALEEPHMRLALLVGPLPLGDVEMAAQHP